MNSVVAIWVSAPGRFSITTGSFHFFDRPSAYSRAAISVVVPPEKGTMMRTGRVGQALSASAAQTGGIIATIRATNENVLIEMPMDILRTALCSNFDRWADQSDARMPARPGLRFPGVFPFLWEACIFVWVA